MLIIDVLIIIHSILNDKINKRIICVMLCYLIINWVMFKFVIFDQFIVHIMFKLMNTIED